MQSAGSHEFRNASEAALTSDIKLSSSVPASSAFPTAAHDAGHLARELERMKLVYNELLSSMDAEITRCYTLLQGLGVDHDGNPLPADEEAVEYLQCT